MKQLLVVASGLTVLAASLLVGCRSDAGWHYASTEGTPIHDDGLRYQLPDAIAGVSTRIYADGFGGRLRVEFKLTNIGTQSLALGIRELSANDAAGATLPRVFKDGRRCEGAQAGGECVLPKGRSYYVAEAFKISPFTGGLKGYFGVTNPALEKVTVRLSAVVGSQRRPISLETQLVRVE